MENRKSPYDFPASGHQNWFEDEEYDEAGGSHNDDFAQIPSDPEAQESTTSFLEEEDVLQTNSEGGQDIPNFDPDYFTEDPTATSPDMGNLFYTQDIHHAETDGSKLENENDYYMGMDNQWHQFLPPQNLQAEGSLYLAGDNQYNIHHQTSTHSVPNGTAPPHLGYPLGVGESPLANLHPGKVHIPQQLQQPRPHSASTQATFGVSQEPTASNYKPDSRSSRAESPSRASGLATEVTTSSNQQATPTNQSGSSRYSYRPFTDADFFPPIRKGGKLLEDKVTWDMEAKKNHYDCWARYHGRPALPQAVKGGLSHFKLRSKAINALDEADQQSLQDFINAAKHFELMKNPNRPSDCQAAKDLVSEDEEERETGSVNQSKTHQPTAPKKRSREETEETDHAPPKRRKGSMSTIGQGNSQAGSLPSSKNPQGQMTFPNMEAANQWLASLGKPSILEAANTLLANQGVPTIIIKPPRSMGLSSDLRHTHVNTDSQSGFFTPPTTGVKVRSVGGPGSGRRGVSRSSVPHKNGSTSRKRKASPDPEDQDDAAHMREFHAKRPHIDDVGITNMQSSDEAAPQRQQAQVKSRRGPQQQHANPTVHTQSQRYSTPILESPSPSYAGTEFAYPEAYALEVPADSGYRSTDSGNAHDVNDYFQYAHITTNRSQNSDLVENYSFSQTPAPPSNNGRRSSIENCQRHQSVDNRLVRDGHENYKNIDTNLGVENQNHGYLDFNPTPVDQQNLADFDFSVSVVEQNDIGEPHSSVLDDNFVPQNTMPAHQNNQNAIENNNSIPQNNNEYDLLNELLGWENVPEEPSQQDRE